MLVIAGTSASNTNWRMRFNSDTGANYNVVGMSGTGSTTMSAAYSGEVFATLVLQGSGGTTNLTNSITSILDYTATDKHKSTLTRSNTSTTATEALANRWANTSAITTVQVFPSGANWAAGSTFALYGIAA